MGGEQDPTEAELQDAGLLPNRKTTFRRGLLLGGGMGAALVLLVIAIVFIPIFGSIFSGLGALFKAFIEATWGH